MSDDFAMRSVEEALDRANTVFELKQRIAALESNVRAAEQFRLQTRIELGGRDSIISEQRDNIAEMAVAINRMALANSNMTKLRETVREISERWWFRAFAGKSLRHWVLRALR